MQSRKYRKLLYSEKVQRSTDERPGKNQRRARSLHPHLDDVLGHVDLVRAQEVKHVHARVVAWERQHRDVEVDAQLNTGATDGGGGGAVEVGMVGLRVEVRVGVGRVECVGRWGGEGGGRGGAAGGARAEVRLLLLLLLVMMFRQSPVPAEIPRPLTPDGDSKKYPTPINSK